LQAGDLIQNAEYRIIFTGFSAGQGWKVPHNVSASPDTFAWSRFDTRCHPGNARVCRLYRQYLLRRYPGTSGSEMVFGWIPR